jgi:hypothetical protein
MSHLRYMDAGGRDGVVRLWDSRAGRDPRGTMSVTMSGGRRAGALHGLQVYTSTLLQWSLSVLAVFSQRSLNGPSMFTHRSMNVPSAVPECSLIVH